jgi:hypothetical protein
MERKHIDKIYNDLRVTLKKNRFTHNLSGKHYKRLFQSLSFPSIFITALISAGGFLVSSDTFDSSVTNGITLSIGFLGILNTTLQTILTNCEYETKNKMFQKAADSYDKLITTLDFDYNNIHNHEDYNSFHQELRIIEGKILKIKDDCTYLPPLFIIEKWHKYKKAHNIENYTIQNETIQENTIQDHTEYDVDENTPLIVPVNNSVNNGGGRFETV